MAQHASPWPQNLRVLGGKSRRWHHPAPWHGTPVAPSTRRAHGEHGHKAAEAGAKTLTRSSRDSFALGSSGKERAGGGGRNRSVFRCTPGEGSELPPSSSTWGVRRARGHLGCRDMSGPKKLSQSWEPQGVEGSSTTGRFGIAAGAATKDQKLSSITPVPPGSDAPHWGTQTGTSCAGLGGPAGTGRGEK